MAKVAFVLFPGFQMLAYVLASETLRIANKCAGAPRFSWTTLSASCAPLEASNGALVTPDRADWRDDDADLVILCAGYDPPATLPAGLKAFLARCARQGAVMGGFDTGAEPLARLGFLDGVAAVLHHEAERGFRDQFPEIRVVDQIYAYERHRLTAAGGIAACDAMLAWIADRESVALARATGQAMAHGAMRPASASQRPAPPRDPLIAAMIETMAGALDAPRSIAQIARGLGVSQKALRRRSFAALGVGPRAFRAQLRLEAARELVLGGASPIAEIAAATGFASQAGFARAYKTAFGRAPSADRRRDGPPSPISRLGRTTSPSAR